MSWLLLAIALGIIIYLLRTRKTSQPEASRHAEYPTASTHERDSGQRNHAGSNGIMVHYRPTPSVAIDLRHEAQRVFRVAGISHWVDPEALGRYAADYFFLRREPDNEYDMNAVAVFGGNRKFGYLEAAAAAEYAALFDQVGSDFIVVRDQIHDGGGHFRLPHLPVLAQKITQGKLTYWHSNS